MWESKLKSYVLNVVKIKIINYCHHKVLPLYRLEIS